MKKTARILFASLIMMSLIIWEIKINGYSREAQQYCKERYYDCVEIITKFEPYVNPWYGSKKELIKPYFDEEWYGQEHAEKLKESGLSPIDHYLQRGWRGNWKRHCDPNQWFNVTLYKERLWPTSSDPFVNFLSQPKLTVKSESESETETIEVQANEGQINRAWMAVEGLLRLNKFNVTLILPLQFKESIPICFKAQMARGLKVIFKQKPLSFYWSDFIKNPDKYGLSDMEKKESYVWDEMITRVGLKNNKDEYRSHQMYFYTKWKKKGIINPIFINIGNYTDEPIAYSMEPEITDFKAFMRRISSGFDLLFLDAKLTEPNTITIPGYMATWVDEMPSTKEFSVSFLLSKFETNKSGILYGLRTVVFNEFKELKNIPSRFYISRRIKGYPKEMKTYLLPTDSKKWIFKSMFNIAIENTQQENYITEKLLGCFETLTVPIYMGCPNVGEWFDTRGMIIVNSLEEMKEAISKLTPELYEEMLPFVKKNKEITQQLLTLKQRYIDVFFESIEKKAG
ncbi:MAG: hypothetical protein HEEMFOPI_00173 [Holosporales bacterium]